MDAPRGQEEHVALTGIVPFQHVHQAVFLHQRCIGIRGYLLFQANEKVAAVVHHIPHLRLAQANSPLCSKGVVGMHLERQVVVGVDELDEQGELPAVNLVQGLSRQWSGSDPGFTLPVTGDHPVLAAPDHRAELSCKLQYHYFALP